MSDNEIFTGEIMYSDKNFESEPSPFQVYAKSTNGLVYTIYSTCFQSVEEGDILIKEGFGDEFVHVGYYKIYDDNGCHNYKIVDDKMVECTEEEKQIELEEQEKNKPLSENEILQQQIADMEIQILDYIN